MQRNAELVNNKGVTSLREGKTLEACELFLIASNLIVDEKETKSNSGKRPQATRKRSSQQQVQRSSCFRYSWTTVEASIDPQNVSTQDTSIISYTFCQAVSIFSKSDGCMSRIAAECKWAVLFNLALSLNLLGYELGENKAGQEYLRRAHEVYKVIRHKFVSKVPKEHVGKVRMALYNNMGCIYNEFTMFEEARVCLDHVRKYLERQAGNAGNKDRHHILLAGVLLQPTTVAPSA